MPILNDADKTKTIAEYLGVTGTPEEIQKKLEDTTAVRDLLAPIFDFKESDLFNSDRKPYPFVIEKLSPMTLGEIERDKGSLLPDLIDFYREMKSDYDKEDTERKPFLRATGYSQDKDGYDKDYFFRFWRNPLTKVLAYRGIDPTTPEGAEKAKEVLEKLYGPEYTKHSLTELISYTPEYLIEEKANIERDNRTKAEREETEKLLLRSQPFFETLKKLDNINFSSNDPVTMAHEAFLQPDAHKRLKEYLRTKEELDEEEFQFNISRTPQQIETEAERAKREPGAILGITIRNDKKYIMDHPGTTFAQLLVRPGRPEIPFGEDAKYQFLYKTLSGSVLERNDPLDKTAINEAMDKPCTELKANADDIVKGVQKRGRRNKILLMSSIILATTAASLGLIKVYNSLSDAVSHEPAPTVQKAQRTADSAVQGDQGQKAGISGALAAVSNQVAAAQAAVDTNAAPQQVAKPDMPTKGNRLVAMQWSGYKDRICRTIEYQAAEWLFTGEFDNMFHEIRTKGLPYGDIYNRDFTSKALGRLNNVVNVGGAPGHAPLKFYLKFDGGRTAQAITQDVLNWHDNMRDALETLPVSKENLIPAQLKAMDAIGPSMGWAAKQQKGWLNANPELAKQARESIAELTAAGIKERKVDTNNVEAVFMETLNAASIYRQNNPQAQGLMLIVDETVRKVAGIELEDVAKFDKVQKPQDAIKPRQDSAVKSPEPQQKTKVVVKKERYGWWWIAASFALGAYLMSARAKRKNQVIK